MRHFGLLASALMILTGGCASLQNQTENAGAVPTAVPRVVGVETPAQREHARILAAYGGAYSDPKTERLLADLAERLAKTSDRPDVVYRVTVLNAPSINAFALPTGDLYVTRGLLSLANDTSEVAAVLAHEIGHVTARHAFERADREKQAVLVSRVMTDVLGDSQAGAMSLAKSRLALARFSREQELEADRIGVRVLARSGFDPYGSSRFLASMARNATLRASQDDGAEIDFLSSHPSTPERVQLATQAAREIGAPGRGERDREVFLSAIEGMVHGDDPRQGYVRGNRFIHPVLGFQVQAPAGFQLENAKDSIVGIGPDGTALRLDAAKLDEERGLEQHLARDLMEGLEVGAIETTTVNELPAAMAVARGRDWRFRLAAIRLGSDVYRIVFAARELTPETDAAFRTSISSFRRLTTAELTSARPQRVAIARVRPGDTVESLAARMTSSDRPMERFLVLNGLPSGAVLEPGSRVKMIVE